MPCIGAGAQIDEVDVRSAHRAALMLKNLRLAVANGDGVLSGHRQANDVGQRPLGRRFEHGEARLAAHRRGVHRQRGASAGAVRQAGGVDAERIVDSQVDWLAAGAEDCLKIRAAKPFGLDAEAGCAGGVLRENVRRRAGIQQGHVEVGRAAGPQRRPAP